MKYLNKILIVSLLLTLKSFAGNDWWIIPTTDFLHLEEINATNTLTLGLKKGSPSNYVIKNDGGVNPCSCSQVNLTPPVGKEGRWLSMLLTAITTGQPLEVYGNCAGGQLDVDGKVNGGRLTIGN